jgi:hypothetical protein
MKKWLVILLFLPLGLGAMASGQKNDAYRADLAKKIATHRYQSERYYVAYLSPGSLKQNVVDIARRYGWQTVVWNAPDDYPWVGRTTIRGQSLQEIFTKILQKYPLQAQFYQGNHVLAIVPRNLP